jgi:hypothetical protein
VTVFSIIIIIIIIIRLLLIIIIIINFLTKMQQGPMPDLPLPPLAPREHSSTDLASCSCPLLVPRLLSSSWLLASCCS